MATHPNQINDSTRAIFGFAFGALLMLVFVHIFIVNSFDFEIMQRGVRTILEGNNPWSPENRVVGFFNPPFSVLFLWPMSFTTPKVFLILGGACLFSFVFYHKAWVALAWFGTNTALWLIAAGGIDMFLIGSGLLLLQIGDKQYAKWSGLIWRVLAYGLLLVKPQGGIFILGLYVLLRRDWKGLLAAGVIFGLLFLPLYPYWIQVIRSDPPQTQILAAHTIYKKFGPVAAVLQAALVTVSRKWKYWQLGGVLAGILSPYGMPGLPIFLTLTSVTNLIAIPVVVIFSYCLALITWVNPPPGVDQYVYIGPFMAIYHLSMLGLALILAITTQPTREAENDRIDPIHIGEWIKGKFFHIRSIVS